MAGLGIHMALLEEEVTEQGMQLPKSMLTPFFEALDERLARMQEMVKPVKDIVFDPILNYGVMHLGWEFRKPGDYPRSCGL